MEKINSPRSVIRFLTATLILAVIFMGIPAIASAQGTGDTAQLTGRLGGTLDEMQTRFGAPSWTDTSLIGYNSQTLAGVDSIVVVYYDERNVVDKISLVYLSKPAQFADPQAISNTVAQVAPMDGTCAPIKVPASSYGSEVYPCTSLDLAKVFDTSTMTALGLEGVAGSYSYSVDPTVDEYYEVIVQLGTSVAGTTSQVPTPAPDASSSSTASSAADETLYAAQVYSQTQRMSESLNRFSLLAQNPDFFSTSWKLDVATELAIWQQTYQEALAMTPPPRFASVHAKYVEGLGYYSQAADEIAYGIDNLDPSALDRAVTLMYLGNASISEASAELNAMAP